jgi:hypothetical protein
LATGNGLHPEINPHPEIILTISGTNIAAPASVNFRYVPLSSASAAH